MDILDKMLDAIRLAVRSAMGVIARIINKLTRGKLSPNTITLIALFAHLPIAWLIAMQKYGLAAILLIIFGLFDTLDGELARLQHKSSNAGMLLDATTDRMKEIMLYIGAAYAIVVAGRPYMAVWAVAACGASLLVSYVKAKGETAIVGAHLSANDANRSFQDGLLRFEVRMAILVVGLLSGRLILAVIVIAILAWLTAIDRLIKITNRLNSDKN